MDYSALNSSLSSNSFQRRRGSGIGNSNQSETETDTENTQSEDEEGRGDDTETEKSNENGGGGEAETWSPSMEGFLKYLVDSKLVFNTLERIVDESDDVAYAYFRKNGLERSACLSKDLEWFSQRDFVVPEPSNPGVSYVMYLEELAEKSAPLFLSHFYNIYFSHIAGGQVIARKVSEQLLEGRELELYKWEGDEQESLKGVREKLNLLGELICCVIFLFTLVVGMVGTAYEWNINTTAVHSRTLMPSSDDIVTWGHRHSAKEASFVESHENGGDCCLH
ncbi:hypothetical protein V6N12_070281 [Hibiscus sabdariffa]|uniref:Inactive heme oxygenase 2, chloroplastic n=1 Tax=Hibiscus sabdariffa TaxID=183260 RepID=A0ABR2FGB6_9ROSI